MGHIAQNREAGGRLVREAWVYWAKKQQNPKSSWLTPWQELSESDKEADRVIWDEVVAPYTTMINQLVEENEELERRIETLETILVALCKNAQTPLHVTQKEYDEAGELVLDIEDDEEGMFISAKSAGAKLNKIIDQIADNLK